MRYVDQFSLFYLDRMDRLCVTTTLVIMVLSFGMFLFAVCPVRVAERFDDLSYLSVRHISSAQPPLSIGIQTSCLPCQASVSALQALPDPATRPSIHTDSPVGSDLSCSDMVSEWLNGTRSEHHCVVAACPRNDLVLAIVACLGANNLPPPTSSGLTVYDIHDADDTVFCSNSMELRLLVDMCASAQPPLLLKTSLLPSSGSTGMSTVALMRPAGHPDVVAALVRSNAVSVRIPKLDPAKFAIKLPLAKLSGNGGGSASIASTTILMGSGRLDGDPRVSFVVRALVDVDQFWALAELNMIAKYVALLPMTRLILRPVDDAAKTRSSREHLSKASYSISPVPVLREAFSLWMPPPVLLISVVAIDAYLTHTSHDGKCRVLEIRHPFIGAARMRLGDRVALFNQPISKHNGHYIVQELATGDRGTVVVTWLEVNYDAISFSDVQGDSFIEKGNPAMVLMTVQLTDMIDPKRGDLWPKFSSPQVDDLLLLRNLTNPDGRSGVWTVVTNKSDTPEGFTIQTLVGAKTSPQQQGKIDGSCVTSPTTEIKSVCLADGDLWDTPCSADDQCPFFQVNLRYPNYRGGCLDSGWCEMPVGVTQTSYRTYQGTPVNHLGRLLDVAFPLDEYERYAFGV